MKRVGDEAISAVQSIANELRSDALNLPEGEFLGSEDSISRRFNVSIPTLRQAARLLEYEEVIKVKRGVRGGYFTSRPKLATVSRAAAVFLRANPASIEDFWDVIKELTPFVVDLILANKRLPELQEFAALDPKPASFPEFRDQEIRCSQLIQELMGNIAIRLIRAIYAEIGFSFIDGRTEMDERYFDVRSIRIDLVNALLDGNRDAAIEAYIELQKKYFDELRRNIKNKAK